MANSSIDTTITTTPTTGRAIAQAIGLKAAAAQATGQAATVDLATPQVVLEAQELVPAVVSAIRTVRAAAIRTIAPAAEDLIAMTITTTDIGIPTETLMAQQRARSSGLIPRNFLMTPSAE
jgi:hypothetical protein